MSYITEQEKFWAGEFGNEYISRNRSDEYLASNLHFFSTTLKRVHKPGSLIEFGANIGMNLKAIKLLFPSIDLFGIEINKKAANELLSFIGNENVFQGSVLDYTNKKKFEVSLTKGFLIHINPDHIFDVYARLYNSSLKYILICEYYSPSPVAVNYRGYENRLFKRDFAGEMLNKYNDLSLLDYGFCYSKDRAFPQDDITWFLLEKK